MRGLLSLVLLAALAGIGCSDDDLAVGECQIVTDCNEGERCINGRCMATPDGGEEDGGSDTGSDTSLPDAPMADVASDVVEPDVSVVDAGGACSEGAPIVLYTFDAPDNGVTITDRAPDGPDVPLTENLGEFSVINAASLLETRGGRLAATQEASDALVAALNEAGSFTVEVWTRALELVQEEVSGPERIVTLSVDSAERAFTLGHDEGDLRIRLQTDGTNRQGTNCLLIPPVDGGTGPSSTITLPASFDALDPPKHIVLVFSGTLGEPRAYFNGEQIPGDWPCDMNMLSWPEGEYQFALGDELTGERAYEGQIHRVAIYPRAMGAAEVSCWYDEGPAADVL